MANNLIDLKQYRDPSSSLDSALAFLSSWDSAKSPSQLNLDQSRLKKLLPELFRELLNKESDLKTKVIALLERAGIPESAFFLLSYLNDSEFEVRERTIQALGSLGDHSAIFPLKDLYDKGSPQHHPQILQSLTKLVDDQFIYKFIGNESNLDQMTMVFEILDMLVTDSEYLLSASAYKKLFLQLVPKLRQARESGFDVTKLQQTINGLHEGINEHLDKNGRSLEKLKFQLKVQHDQLERFLEVSPPEDLIGNDLEEDQKAIENLPAEPLEPDAAELPELEKEVPEISNDARIDLKELIVRANRNAFIADPSHKKLTKKIKYEESIMVHPHDEQNICDVLQSSIFIANFLSAADQMVGIEIESLGKGTAISLLLQGVTSNHAEEPKQNEEASPGDLTKIPEIQTQLKNLSHTLKTFKGSFKHRLGNKKFSLNLHLFFDE
ncbi:MAG: HEAT repeat domain-containing protein [SAR324 cluster bacterium]|nr:HEAT repeat domain-containing protein [SAR324 cluster bacterium]